MVPPQTGFHLNVKNHTKSFRLGDAFFGHFSRGSLEVYGAFEWLCSILSVFSVDCVMRFFGQVL